MRWLILPDIHDKIRRANQIIEREPHDRLLLLGDYFDDFQTGVTDAADTAKQVKAWLNAPNTTCLLGNHDMSYGWRRLRRICSGFRMFIGGTPVWRGMDGRRRSVPEPRVPDGRPQAAQAL